MSEKIRWLGPYAPTDRHADDVTLQELVRLRVENEKMQTQLQKLRDYLQNIYWSTEERHTSGFAWDAIGVIDDG